MKTTLSFNLIISKQIISMIANLEIVVFYFQMGPKDFNQFWNILMFSMILI